MAEQSPEFLKKVRHYADILNPLFFPAGGFPPSYLYSLLRVGGMQDDGWDSLQESREFLDDLFGLLRGPLDSNQFKNPDKTRWRLYLLFYAHMVEMDAPYEVIANLLHSKINNSFSPAPFGHLRTYFDGKKRAGMPLVLRKYAEASPAKKIKYIQELAVASGVTQLGAVFSDFYYANIRNAIDHSDFVLTEHEFRIVAAQPKLQDAFYYPSRCVALDKLSEIITSASAFYSAFFSLERQAKKHVGRLCNRGFQFDTDLKGVLELTADNDGLLNGFKVHWPNERESTFRRSSDGSCEMANCMFVGDGDGRLEFFVGEYFAPHHPASALVPANGSLVYTPLSNGSPLTWPS